jgi:hypothetical protein
MIYLGVKVGFVIVLGFRRIAVSSWELCLCILNTDINIANINWICEISSSHGGEYDVQNCLLGCTAV